MASGNGSGFEAGTSGATLTAAVAAADTVLITGHTAVISTAQAAHGTKSVLMTATSATGGCYFQKTLDPTDQIAVRLYMYMTALPSEPTGLIFLGDGASQRMHLEMSAAGALRIRDDDNVTTWNGTVTTSTGTVPLNQWVRIELIATRHATAGTFRVAVYAADGTTPLSGLDSGARTGQKTGTTSWNNLRVGPKTGTGAATMTMYVDDWDYDPAATTFIGPYVEFLPAPSSLTITDIVSPTTLGGSNGQVEIAWGSSAGATTYEMAIVEGEVTSGFTALTTDSASPHRFTGLEAGVYTVAVRAV